MSLLTQTFKEACFDFANRRLLLFTFVPTILLFVIAAILTWSLLGASNVEQIPGWIAQIEQGKLSWSMLPLIKVAIVIPLIVVFALLSVSFFMLPLVSKSVEKRVAGNLPIKNGGNWMGSSWEGLRATVLAVLTLVILSPLWIPSNLGGIFASIVMGIPCWRAFSYDALIRYASVDERRMLWAQHKSNYRIMGAVFGFLSFLPGIFISLAFSTNRFVEIPIDMILAVWVYALVYAFTAAWFAHYSLATIKALREQQDARADAASLKAYIKNN